MRINERPLNTYAYSKFLFDEYLRPLFPSLKSPVVGLRYFNVYGPREQHKGKMASVAYHLRNQLQSGDTVRLFEGFDGYACGEQMRDFIHIDDVVAVNLWLLDNPCVVVFLIVAPAGPRVLMKSRRQLLHTISVVESSIYLSQTISRVFIKVILRLILASFAKLDLIRLFCQSNKVSNSI